MAYPARANSLIRCHLSGGLNHFPLHTWDLELPTHLGHLASVWGDNVVAGPVIKRRALFSVLSADLQSRLSMTLFIDDMLLGKKHVTRIAVNIRFAM